MKVLLINQYFYPDVAATAQLMTDLTEDLASRNIKMTVLTSNSRYNGGKLDGSRNGRQPNAKIIRVNSSSLGKRNNAARLLDYLSFYFLVTVRSLFLCKQDVVIALTTPPLLSLVGLLLKVVKRSKFVYLVEDVYPDTAVAFGVLKKDGILTGIMNHISNQSYRHADRVIAISEKMKTTLTNKGVATSTISTIHNWADVKQIYPVCRNENRFISRNNLEKYFTVQYSGNMGVAHDFETFLGGIVSLRDLEDIKFLFIGDGVRKKEILMAKERWDLANLYCFPYQKRHDLPFSISAGDVSLISLKSSFDGFIVPCKIYGIMAAARPVIMVGKNDSDIARLIQSAECGFQIDEGDVDGFIEKILLLHSDSDLAKKFGENGHRYFLENFERRIATEQYYRVLMNLN